MTKELIAFRCDDTLNYIMKNICRESKLTKTDFLELAIVEFLAKWKKDLIYDGVDFKEYAKSVKLEKLRRIISKERQQFLSKNLMIARINIDILKIITTKKRNNNTPIKELILDYLKIRKKEAEYHKDNKELLKEITEIEKISEQKIGEIKTFVKDQLSDINYLKMITQQHESH